MRATFVSMFPTLLYSLKWVQSQPPKNTTALEPPTTISTVTFTAPTLCRGAGVGKGGPLERGPYSRVLGLQQLAERDGQLWAF